MNKLADSKVILITGASSGIGKSCAEFLSQQGYRVYGTSRKPVAKDLTFAMIQMDVNEDRSVTGGIQHILDQEGRLDVVINNAGYGMAGSVEETSPADMKQQFETNYYGMLRVCQGALPGMRAQRSGLIINVSSIAGLIGVPFQGAYSASKYAVEGLTEVLRMEVKPFGINVVLIEPGDFQTGFTDHRIRADQMQTDSPYTQYSDPAIQVMEADERQGEKPERIARLVNRIILKSAPGLRYTTGPIMQRFAVQLKKILPSRIFERIMMNTYKMKDTVNR